MVDQSADTMVAQKDGEKELQTVALWARKSVGQTVEQWAVNLVDEWAAGLVGRLVAR